MKNKDIFKALVRGQPANEWTKHTYGWYEGDLHCKVGHLLWQIGFRGMHSTGFTDKLMSFYDLTERQFQQMIFLNDSSLSSEEATERIVNYVNHLRNT